MIYVVTPYIDRQQGIELELSIQSWEKYFEEDFKRLVIGDRAECLGWHPEVEFVEQNRAEDKRGGQYLPHLDHANKFLTVCKTLGDGERFIRVADDCYLVNPVTMEDIDRHYVNGMDFIGNRYSGNGFKKDQWKTRQLLDREGKPHLNYTIHSPMVYETTRLRELIEKYDMIRESYVIEDLYFNTYVREEKAIKLESASDDVRGCLNHVDFFEDLTEIMEWMYKTKKWVYNTNSGYNRSMEESLRKRVGGGWS